MAFTDLLVVLIALEVVLGLKEYCLFDNFTASCPKGEVIIISSAKYGRMNSVDCIDKNRDNLGCSEDVLPFIDKLCSGKSHCSYVVGEHGLHELSPCGQLKSYLQVSYECLPVHQICKSSTLHLHRSSSGYLSSYSDDNDPCVDPVKIEALPGQVINISILDFSNAVKSKCVNKGQITDIAVHRTVSICSSGQRQQNIYISNGNVLELSFKQNHHSEHGHKRGEFLLGYKVHGCADLNAPVHGWYERSGDNAVIGCSHKDVKWHLHCNGDKWEGVTGNCSDPGASVAKVDAVVWDEMPKENFILILTCVFFGIILIISVCGLAMYLRHRAQTPNMMQEEYRFLSAPGYHIATDPTSATLPRHVIVAATLPRGQQQHFLLQQQTQQQQSPPTTETHHFNPHYPVYNSPLPPVPVSTSPDVMEGVDLGFPGLMAVYGSHGSSHHNSGSVYTNLDHSSIDNNSVDTNQEQPKYFILDKDFIDNMTTNASVDDMLN